MKPYPWLYCSPLFRLVLQCALVLLRAAATHALLLSVSLLALRQKGQVYRCVSQSREARCLSGNVAVGRQTHVSQLEGRHGHLVGARCGLGQRERARLDTKGGRFLALFFLVL